MTKKYRRIIKLIGGREVWIMANWVDKPMPLRMWGIAPWLCWSIWFIRCYRLAVKITFYDKNGE